MSGQVIVGKRWPPPRWFLASSGTITTPTLISPAAGDTYQLRDKVLFIAVFGALTDLVTPNNGLAAITKVEFFSDGVLVATTLAFPWIAYVDAATITAGAHNATCKVTYTSGPTRTSAAKAFTVVAAPATNPGSFAATKLWSDYSDLTSYTPINPTPGTSISAVTNKQGTAVFANQAQGTPASQPTVDFIRGLSCVFYGNGFQQHLDSAITGVVAQPWQVFQICRIIGSGTTGTMWAGGAGGNLKFNGTASDWPLSYSLNANVDLIATNAVPDSRAHTQAFQATAAGFINQDGVNLATGTTGSRTLSGTFAHGAGSTGAAAISGGFVTLAVSTGMTGADQTTVINALIAMGHTSEASAERFDIGDSQAIGIGATNGMGYRYMSWFGTNGVPWKIPQAKIAGKWLESSGPLFSGPSGRPGFIDDTTFNNSGKGINFFASTIAARMGPGMPYANRDIGVFEPGAANARNLAGETFVPGTGPGSTYQAWVDLANLYASFLNKGFVWFNLTDSNPAFGTGSGSTWANIRVMNGYWLQAVAAVQAANPTKKIVPVDQFNFVGPWNNVNFADEVHLADPGCALYALGGVQGLAQMCATW